MDLNGVARRQLFLCFDMMENLIDSTPASIWNQKKGGYVYWQQLLHALNSSLYWLRTDPENFEEPFKDRNVYPDLDKDPESDLTKEQILQVLNEAKELAGYFFDHYDSGQLLMDSVQRHDIFELDTVFMQVRHLMYHIGHCDAILREAGYDVPAWVGLV